MNLSWRLGTALAAGLCLGGCASEVARRPATSEIYADHLVGRLANLRQDHAAAAQRYFQALSRAPGDERLLNGAITSSLASGNVVLARQAVRMAPRIGAPAYVHLVRAVDNLNTQRWRQANDELDHIEGGAAEELIGRMVAVWTRAAQGQADGVVADLAPLASIRPYGALLSYQQALALDYAGRDADALAAYRRGAEGGVFMPPAVERHADLLARTGARDEAVAVLSTEANRGNPALAAELERVQAGAPGVNAALTPSRGAAIGLYGLAAIFTEEHDSTNALATLTLALMLDPDLDAARLSFAQVQAGLQHGDLAREALAHIPPASPYASSARVMQAWGLVDENRSDEGIALMRAGADAGDLRAKRALADMYRRLERYDEAEPIYSELIAARPQDWRLYFARGAARERLGHWPDAEADFLRALELQPEQPDVMNYLGYVWVDRGEHMQEGLAMIQRAVLLNPQSGSIIDSLGWAYFRLGEYAHAVDFLERAVQLEPADATLNDHLGDAYWRMNRRTEARFQWRAALNGEPEDRAAIEAKLERGLPDEPATRSATR